LVLAIEHFHKNEIIYRSLSPENILLDKFGHIKVIQKLLFVEDKGSQAFEASLEYMGKKLLGILGNAESAGNIGWERGWICSGLVVIRYHNLFIFHWNGKLHFQLRIIFT
jgi:serine/threonine protein kinase